MQGRANNSWQKTHTYTKQQQIYTQYALSWTSYNLIWHSNGLVQLLLQAILLQNSKATFWLAKGCWFPLWISYTSSQGNWPVTMENIAWQYHVYNSGPARRIIEQRAAKGVPLRRDRISMLPKVATGKSYYFSNSPLCIVINSLFVQREKIYLTPILYCDTWAVIESLCNGEVF